MAKWIGYRSGTASAPNTRKGRKSERRWIARMLENPTITGHVAAQIQRDLDEVDKRKRSREVYA